MAKTAEQRREYWRAYYAANRERLRAEAKARREANLLAVRESTRKSVAIHYVGHREAILAAKKERYASDPAMRERMRANARRRHAKLKAEREAA